MTAGREGMSSATGTSTKTGTKEQAQGRRNIVALLDDVISTPELADTPGKLMYARYLIWLHALCRIADDP